jgi:hypothetical protein
MRLLKLPGPPPNDEQCAQGSKYTLVMPIDIKAMMTVRGEIYRESNELYWHWRLQRWPSAECNLARPWRPTFIVNRPEGGELFRIRRSSWFPATFEMLENGSLASTIELRSPLRNRYIIRICNGPVWHFHMPIFTQHLYCESDAGGQLWGIMGPSESQWNLLTAPGSNDARIVAIMAFLHYQRA